MAGKNGDRVRSEFYDPQLMGKLEYARNPTIQRTRRLEQFYIFQLTNMAVNRFKWEGLPDFVSERFLEMALLHRGLAVFFKEKEIYDDFLVMRAGGVGPINIYDDPINFMVQGGTGEMALSLTLDNDECVPIWANVMRIPEFPHIQIFANRLAEIDRTIEISSLNARQTKFVSVPEDQINSANQVIKQMAEGVTTVFGNEDMADLVKSITTVDLESHPTKLMNLLISKGKIWNEVMTFLGVNNSNQDKKERLVSDEVAANDQQIDLVKRMNLSARQLACDQINDMFGLNVSVDFYQGEVDISADQGVSANGVPKAIETPSWSAE